MKTLTIIFSIFIVSGFGIILFNLNVGAILGDIGFYGLIVLGYVDKKRLDKKQQYGRISKNL
jgi:hypothetical protein